MSIINMKRKISSLNSESTLSLHIRVILTIGGNIIVKVYILWSNITFEIVHMQMEYAKLLYYQVEEDYTKSKWSYTLRGYSITA